MITHTTLWEQWQTVNQITESQHTPYLALKGQLWHVYCEDFGENWPCYNGTALYIGRVYYEKILHAKQQGQMKNIFKSLNSQINDVLILTKKMQEDI